MILQLIIISVLFIIIGVLIYFYSFYNKDKPKVDIKRNSFPEYYKDYLNIKLYTSSII